MRSIARPYSEAIPRLGQIAVEGTIASGLRIEKYFSRPLSVVYSVRCSNRQIRQNHQARTVPHPSLLRCGAGTDFEVARRQQKPESVSCPSQIKENHLP